MARIAKKLSALEVSRIKSPGKYPLGERLYLQVSANGSKSWIFRYAIGGKSTWMGLGSSQTVSLGEVRSKVTQLHAEILRGDNPLLLRQRALMEKQLKEVRRITFDACAKNYLDAHAPSWKHAKHISQWENSLETYVSPVIGNLSIQDIDTAAVLKVLQPIWYDKAETANRLRGRIERIISWAAVRGYRSNDNPAQWRGHLDQLLPKKSTIQGVTHFKALPIAELPHFISKLKEMKGGGALAFEFLILTATRTNETLGAKWSEINFSEKYWLIPGTRMKGHKDHKIPLSRRALEILECQKESATGEYVFPGLRSEQPLSSMAFLMILRRMQMNITAHGFRSTFSDWAAEKTNFPREVVELALAHAIKNKVEAAYRRGDLFEKRRALMAEWDFYCNPLLVVEKTEVKSVAETA